jgi:hypothetical protein
VAFGVEMWSAGSSWTWASRVGERRPGAAQDRRKVDEELVDDACAQELVADGGSAHAQAWSASPPSPNGSSGRGFAALT